MGLFSFRNVKSKLTSTRFSYSLTVHSLQPWPAGKKAIAIGWQRGKERRGATRSVYPSTAPGKVGTVVRFNEKFDIPATLYKASGAPAPGSASLGPFKKKCLILAVLETDGQTQATAALGRVVIDLAEYAAVDGHDIRTFQVVCNKAVHTAVGDPQLTVTIRCRWQKAGAGGSSSPSPASAVDEVMSNPSTDTTGSRLTANLSSFLRFRHSKQVATNEEQDLRGFENAKALREQQSANLMERIDESQDEGSRTQDNAAAVKAAFAAAARMKLVGASAAAAAAPMALASPPPLPPSMGSPAGPRLPVGVHAGRLPLSATATGTYEEDGYTRDDDLDTESLRLRNGSRTPPSLNGSSIDVHGAGVHTPGGRMQPGMSAFIAESSALTELDQDESSSAGRASALQLHGASESALLRALQGELLSVAAIEVCVYLAAVTSHGRDPTRSVHAPARRLARTLVSLSPEESAVFGAHAVRLIVTQVRSAAGELGSLAMWWTNVVHLRAILQGLHQGHHFVAQGRGASSVSALIPELQALEKSLFDELLLTLWERWLLPPVLGPSSAVGKAPAPTAKRAAQEAALKRWFEGLEAVVARLARMGKRGHAPLLKQQLMRQCLKRVDALLFFYLLAGDELSGEVLQDYDPDNSLWGGAAVSSVPKLDETSLPFAKGVLSFGGGMSVKMTVTRLHQWANSEGVVHDVWDHSLDQGSSLFPLLRGAADLLMMPKELLMDRCIRQDVCTSLSMRSVMYMMTKFSADEFAHEAVCGEVLEALQEEALLGGGGQRTQLTNLSEAYKPPSGELLLRKVEAGAEPGIEYDADSETELDGVGHLAAAQQPPAGSMISPGTGAVRFRLLHELWASGVPRKRSTGFVSK